MIIENVKVNNSIKSEGFEVELRGYTDNFEEAMDMNNFIGEELCYCEDEAFEMLPEPLFGGAYYPECSDELVYITKVIYNKPAVIILWSDGTKTRSTCDKEDIWNPDLGLMLCVMKKIHGQAFVNKLFRDWVIEFHEPALEPEESLKIVTLKDIRRNLKEIKDAADFAEKVIN